MAAFAGSGALTWSKGNHDCAKIVWDINLNRRTCSVSYMLVKPKNLSRRSGSVGNSAICRSVSHRSENYMVIYSMNWTFMQTKVHSHAANTFGDVIRGKFSNMSIRLSTVRKLYGNILHKLDFHANYIPYPCCQNFRRCELKRNDTNTILLRRLTSPLVKISATDAAFMIRL